MGQKSEPPMLDQVFILGLDRCGNARGARFTILRDSIVSAAMDLNCRVLIGQPHEVSALGRRLPMGTVLGTGVVVRLLVPNIRRGLYEAILDAARIAAQQEKARLEAAISRTVH